MGKGWNSRKLKSICVKHEESGVSLFPAFYIFHTVTIIITTMIIMEEGRLIYSCPVLLCPCINRVFPCRTHGLYSYPVPSPAVPAVTNLTSSLEYQSRGL